MIDNGKGQLGIEGEIDGDTISWSEQFTKDSRPLPRRAN